MSNEALTWRAERWGDSKPEPPGDPGPGLFRTGKSNDGRLRTFSLLALGWSILLAFSYRRPGSNLTQTRSQLCP